MNTTGTSTTGMPAAKTGAAELAARQARPANIAIIGLGRIAPAMAQTITGMEKDPRYSSLVRAYAVATHDNPGRARDFAQQYGFQKSTAPMEELFADPDVDIVYIATPHLFHEAEAVAALRAGKAVLVEKAFTGNASQCKDPDRRLAPDRQRGGRGHLDPLHALSHPDQRDPLHRRHRRHQGDQRHPLVQHHGQTADHRPGPRRRRSARTWACTGLNFVAMVTDDAGARADRDVGRHDRHGCGRAPRPPHSTCPGGILATVTCSCVADDDRFGLIHGTKGYAVVTNINNPERIDLYDGAHRLIRSEALDLEEITGYEQEVVAYRGGVAGRRTEAPGMPHAQTLRLMEQMDTIRKSGGSSIRSEK